MANLKDLRTKISSVKSTRRITSAMKMVAAAKLRRAQDMAESARPYAERMERMLSSLAASAAANPESAPPMLATRGDSTHLLVLISSDRGLCGGFNANVLRNIREKITQLEADGKTVKLIVVGRKGYASLRRDMRSISVSLMVGFLYGSMVWGVLPTRPQMSWEMHLGGAVVGLLLAFVYSDRDRVPLVRYDGEDDDEVPEWYPEKKNDD